MALEILVKIPMYPLFTGFLHEPGIFSVYLNDFVQCTLFFNFAEALSK